MHTLNFQFFFDTFFYMYLFAFLSFPLSALCFYLFFKGSGRFFSYIRSNFLVLLFGFACAALYCTVLEFFLFLSPYCGLRFFHFVFKDWIRIFAVPVLFFFLYFLWCKDSTGQKIQCCTGFLTAFQTVYVPFYVLHTENPESFFSLFFMPLLIFIETISVSYCLKLIFLTARKSKILPVAVFFAMILLSFVPPVLMGMSCFGVSEILIFVISAGYAAISVFFALRQKIKISSL